MGWDTDVGLCRGNAFIWPNRWQSFRCLWTSANIDCSARDVGNRLYYNGVSSDILDTTHGPDNRWNGWRYLYNSNSLAGATYITATAYISDITKPEERGAAFGMIGAAFGIGFVFGPALGGIASSWHITAPFWVAAAFSILNMFFGLLILPESLKEKNRRAFGKRDLNPFASIVRAFLIPGLATPLICIFIFEFANMVYPTLWAFWVREVFGWGSLTIGLTLSAYGILIAAVQAGLLPQMTKRIGDYKTLIFASISAVVALVGFGFTTTAWAVAIVMPIAALSDMAPPLLTAFAANRVADNKQGLVQGVIASLASVAAVLAPLVLTGAFERFVNNTGLYFPGAPFIIAAALTIAIIPLMLRLKPQTTTT